MSDEIKKEAQDTELNAEELDNATGGGFFDIIPSKKCLSCNKVFTIREASEIVNGKCPKCGGTVVNYNVGM